MNKKSSDSYDLLVRIFLFLVWFAVVAGFLSVHIYLHRIEGKIEDLAVTQTTQAKAQALNLKTACPKTTEEFFRDYVVGGSVSDWTLHRDNNTPYTKFTFVKEKKGDVKMIYGVGITGTSTMLYPAFQSDISQALYIPSGAQLIPVSNGTTYGCYNIE